ncbi:MAG: glycosyltransferase family 2 protein [Sarcina sp.]
MGIDSKVDKVSIITPAYNAENFIEDTIKSVLNQTYKNFEMIIVDDCSKDRTAEIVKKYMEQDDRIVYKKLSGNSGAAVVRNKAIELATGRYIAFLDSDDLWEKTKLEKQVHFMKEKQAGFCYTAYKLMNEDGTSKEVDVHVPKSVSYKELLKNTIIGCLTVMIDTDVVKNVKMLNVKVGEDTASWLKIIRENNIIAYGIDETLASYRVCQKSLSSNKIVAAKAMWRTYRECEKIGLFKSSFYFISYAKNAVMKRRKK